MIAKKKIIKIDLKRRRKTEKEDLLATDKPINIFVNGKHFVTLMASPKNLKELAIGHLIGEGIIYKLEEIERVRVRGTDVDVRTREAIQPESAKSFRLTSFGASEGTPEFLSGSSIPKPKFTEFEAGDILEAFKSLHSMSNVYRRTGGTHAAALFTMDGKLYFCFEDVGRHNAVDKVIGRGVIENLDFSKSFLILSGRLSADIVIKCARAGIPLVASKAAPLHSGVLAAEMSGLTLVGFARGTRLNVYANPDRVKP